MGKLIFCLTIALFSIASPAADDDGKWLYCRVLGAAFQSAAYFKDQGFSPQSTFDNVRETFISEKTGKSKGGITADTIKQAVNLVYFNPSFAYAGGFELQQQIEGSCMRDGKPQFQPLK